MEDMISVIIPTRNRKHLLRNAINSVKSQTVGLPLEIIVVDDSSEDGTEEMVRFEYNDVKFIRHKTPKGGSAARNTGIYNAKGKYISFLDDDDTFLEKKLCKQISKMQSDINLGMIYTGYNSVDLTGTVLRSFTPEKRGFIFDDLIIENCVKTTSTTLIKHECFEKCGFFDESLLSAQDWDMWLRISREFKIDYVPEPLVNYLIHTNKITMHYGSKISGHLRILDKYEPELNRDNKAIAKHYFEIGYYFCKNGDIKTGRNWFRKSLKKDPTSFKRLKFIIPAVLGKSMYEIVAKAHEIIKKRPKGKV